MLTLTCHKLFNLVLILCAVQINSENMVEISSYSRVSKNGDSHGEVNSKGRLLQPTSSNTTATTTTKFNDADSIDNQQSETIQAAVEGRAIKNDNFFQLVPNFITKAINNKPQQQQRVSYPKYNNANNINQMRQPYFISQRQPVYPIEQVAQKRFSPGEAYAGTVYKIKHPEKFPGYQYPKPTISDTTKTEVKMPVVQPQYLPPSPAQSPPQYLPPSKFSKPIVVADIEETESSTPLPQFLPTILPIVASRQSSNSNNNNNSKRENQNFIVDLLKYENNVNTSYIPTELHAIRAAMENNQIDDVTEVPELENDLTDISSSKQEDVSIILPEELNKFPFNSYNGTNERENKVEFAPPPSGKNDGKIIGKNIPTMSDDNGNVYKAPNDLHAFPPNINSIYFPPDMQSQLFRYTSYIPPPSGSRKNPPARDLLSQLQTNLNGRTKAVRMPNDDENSYQPPRDLHAFPPNVNSFYSPASPSQNPQLSLFNSYIPQPSGDQKEIDLSSNYLNPSRPISIDLLNDAQLQNDLNAPSGKVIRMPDGSSYLPPNDLHSFPPVNSVYLPPEMNPQPSLFNSYIPPASGNQLNDTIDLSSQYLPPPSLEPPSPTSQQNEAQLNNEPAGPMMMMANPPSAPPTGMGDDMMIPPTSPDDSHDHDHDHDHHHHHHHDHPWDSYPDYVFDDHHHHHHHVEEVITTTAAPAPEEPRVKKYSYYYLGRKLWYIPLYFTLWFCLYVAALIIRSIGRHKVDLPNHYQRSLHDLSNREVIEKINTMTNFAMTQIEDFKEKYL